MAQDDSTSRTVKETAKATQAAAGHAAAAARSTMSSADRTTQLAMDRTVLAAERTYAAWVRTGLGALASGLGAQKLLEGVIPLWLVRSTGTVLVLFSAFCFLAGIWRQLFPDRSSPPSDVRHMPTPILVFVNGFLALVALSALVAVWLGPTR
ncbi:DUF202 domain-containing protein [uncultured Alsobacter sp.]|uniref:YidH family protein n=1 Tax=uncultured Alsobacter sp. TaxID=1748258 RepID=UPI0025EE2553|nr:DUF202 domain-containing protein [uncultured Alsobacter sp.]